MQTPDGRMQTLTVPEGLVAGQTLEVFYTPLVQQHPAVPANGVGGGDAGQSTWSGTQLGRGDQRLSLLPAPNVDAQPFHAQPSIDQLYRRISGGGVVPDNDKISTFKEIKFNVVVALKIAKRDVAGRQKGSTYERLWNETAVQGGFTRVHKPWKGGEQSTKLTNLKNHILANGWAAVELPDLSAWRKEDFLAEIEAMSHAIGGFTAWDAEVTEAVKGLSDAAAAVREQAATLLSAPALSDVPPTPPATSSALQPAPAATSSALQPAPAAVASLATAALPDTLDASKRPRLATSSCASPQRSEAEADTMSLEDTYTSDGDEPPYAAAATAAYSAAATSAGAAGGVWQVAQPAASPNWCLVPGGLAPMHSVEAGVAEGACVSAPTAPTTVPKRARVVAVTVRASPVSPARIGSFDRFSVDGL